MRLALATGEFYRYRYPGEYIRLVNDGQVFLRSRGDNKTSLNESLKGARTKALDFFCRPRMKSTIQFIERRPLPGIKKCARGKDPWSQGETTAWQDFEGVFQEVLGAMPDTPL